METSRVKLIQQKNKLKNEINELQNMDLKKFDRFNLSKLLKKKKTLYNIIIRMINKERLIKSFTIKENNDKK